MTLEQILNKQKSINSSLASVLSESVGIVNSIAGSDCKEEDKLAEAYPNSLIGELTGEQAYSEVLIEKLFANNRKLANSIYNPSECVAVSSRG